VAIVLSNYNVYQQLSHPWPVLFLSGALRGTQLGLSNVIQNSRKSHVWVHTTLWPWLSPLTIFTSVFAHPWTRIEFLFCGIRTPRGIQRETVCQSANCSAHMQISDLPLFGEIRKLKLAEMTWHAKCLGLLEGDQDRKLGQCAFPHTALLPEWLIFATDPSAQWQSERKTKVTLTPAKQT
jgi:hypothetical protein